MITGQRVTVGPFISTGKYKHGVIVAFEQGAAVVQFDDGTFQSPEFKFVHLERATLDTQEVSHEHP